MVLCGLMAVAVTLLVPAARAQSLPRPSPRNRPFNAPTQTMPAPVPSAPVAAQPVQAPVEATPESPEPPPAKAPLVTYKEGQLTIVAENSTLSDIVAALRSATGAVIDLPPDAPNERFWLRVGPGPARKVMASP